MPDHPHVETPGMAWIQSQRVEVAARESVGVGLPAPAAISASEKALPVRGSVQSPRLGIPRNRMDLLPPEPGGDEPPAEAAVIAPEQAEVGPGEDCLGSRKEQERMKVPAGAGDSEEWERLPRIDGSLRGGTLMGCLVTVRLPGSDECDERGRGNPPPQDLAGAPHSV